MTLAALLAAALACPTLPPAMLEIVVGNVLANENAEIDERAVVRESNGTYSYGLGMINAVNLDWTGLRGHEFEPCANLTASAKVFLARYPGSPSDQIKKVYAARAMMRIAGLRLRSETPVVSVAHATETPDLEDAPGQPETLHIGE